jgi:hypothetical protein
MGAPTRLRIMWVTADPAVYSDGEFQREGCPREQAAAISPPLSARLAVGSWAIARARAMQLVGRVNLKHSFVSHPLRADRYSR